MSRGHIEQIGGPTEIYGSPATPFVAEFVGTINWVEAEVLDGSAGEVDYRGIRLAVDAVQGRAKGQRVVVVVRPEAIELELQSREQAPRDALAGRVKSHSFLGATTRLKIDLEDRADFIADVPSTRARAFSIGTLVIARFAPDAPRVLNLPPG
jgi:putative spermidine/putrescine transport system ATP-binding protein